MKERVIKWYRPSRYFQIPRYLLDNDNIAQGENTFIDFNKCY